MRHNTDNTEYVNKDLREIENTILNLRLKNIDIPKIDYMYANTRPIISNYTNFFSNITISQKRIFSLMMSVPAFAFILTFILWDAGDDSQIYLATNDVKVLEESNNKIIDKINSLDNIYEK